MNWINKDYPPQRRIMVVIVVALGLWGYATLSDLLFVYYQQGYLQTAGGKISYSDMGTRWLQHFLMLPLFMMGYLGGLYLYQSTLRGPVKWSLQIVAGFLYSLCVRPLFFAAVAIMHGRASYFSSDVSVPFWTLVSDPLFVWISNTTSNFAIYLLGIFLLAVFFSRLDLAEERLRLERLSSEWLTVKLRTLQWQINPHFLFNSLNTVSSLLRSSPGRADSVLAKFSELLRLTLMEQENLYSSVSAELEYIHRYLEMEMVRFEDRLKLNVEADEAALQGQVPSLLLQPLIENAIKHGVARIPGRAAVEVSVTRSGASLVMSVKNSIPDQPPSSLATGMGLGIRNLKERLSTLYDDAFRFTYGLDDEGAWMATVEIPFTRHSGG
jgi:two-component sensor histidine kinase